jgi:hypothetical protein
MTACRRAAPRRTLAIKECPACRFVYIDSAPRYQVQAETMAWERTTRVEEQRGAAIRPI